MGEPVRVRRVCRECGGHVGCQVLVVWVCCLCPWSLHCQGASKIMSNVQRRGWVERDKCDINL